MLELVARLRLLSLRVGLLVSLLLVLRARGSRPVVSIHIANHTCGTIDVGIGGGIGGSVSSGVSRDVGVRISVTNGLGVPCRSCYASRARSIALVYHVPLVYLGMCVCVELVRTFLG